jgi:hypothetical protein
MNNQYNTLLEAIEEFKKRGYTCKLWVNDNTLLNVNRDKMFEASEVILEEFYRLEEMNNI